METLPQSQSQSQSRRRRASWPPEPGGHDPSSRPIPSGGGLWVGGKTIQAQRRLLWKPPAVLFYVLSILNPPSRGVRVTCKQGGVPGTGSPAPRAYSAWKAKRRSGAGTPELRPARHDPA